MTVPILSATPAAAGTPVAITSPALSVSVDQDFPRVISYTDRASGNVLHGNEDTLTDIRVNGTTYTPTVTSTVAADKVDYRLTFSGVTIDARLSVSGSNVEFAVTSISDTASLRVSTFAIPGHNLVSVRSDQTGAALATAKMNTNTTGTGDTFTAVTATTAADTSPTGVMFAVANTAQLGAAIVSNSYYDSPSGGTADENGRVQKQVVAKSGYRRAGLWSGDWLYRPSGAPLTQTEPLPYAKVAITKDRNADSVVDWQDAAVAHRDIWTPPTGWQDTADRVVQRIPFNFASLATHPFTQTLDETKRVNLATDGLGQFVLLKGYGSEGHDSAHMDYGFVGERMGGDADFRLLTDAAEAWNADMGVHVNAQEEYPVSRTFDPARHTGALGWDWLDQSYVVNHRLDGQSGQRVARMTELKNKAPNLDFFYVDVWYGDGYVSRRLAREINGLGLQIATEFPDKMIDNALWAHWSADVNYGGTNYKGVNSQLARFIGNHTRDDWIVRHPLLGGAEIEAYEGWQGKKDFTRFLQTTFGVNLPTKYLQSSPIVKWTSDTVTLANGAKVTNAGGTRVITEGGREVLRGGAYLLPRDGKLYHWNSAGGNTTWTLPAGWSSPKLYRLTDTGRVLVGDLTVTSGQVTVNASANTAYVVYNGAAPTQATPNWGQGTPLKDPGFYAGDLSAWTVSGTGAAVARNANGQNELTIAANSAPTVSQQLTGLSQGTYSASVWVTTPSGRKATLAVTPTGGTAASVYADWSGVTQAAGGSEKNGSTMQRMKVLFDVPAGQTTATLALSAATGSGTVVFDDVRVVRSARTPLNGHYFTEDFENVDAGWGPFVVGGGSQTDPRTHLAQRNAPYTQAGWNGKLVDDVITGGNSLKSHEERQRLIYQTVPQTLRFTEGRQYKVTLNYQAGFGNEYAFVTGSGASETSTTNFAQARTTTSFTKTFTAGPNAWIGVRKLTAEGSNNEADLIVDDLVVDDLGAGTGGDPRVPQSGMTVIYVDSQETSGENGAAANVLDGNAGTIWHTAWSAGNAPYPHEIQLDLGATYNVSSVYYLPRQSQTNGRIANYEVYTSTDGTSWGTAAATGTFQNATTEQTVAITPRQARYVRLRALSEVNGNPWASAAELNVGYKAATRIAQSGITVESVDSEDTASGGNATNVLDGNPATLWHTAWSQVDPDTPYPHEIVLDLARAYSVSCLHYLPRQTGVNGKIGNYEVYVSADGTTWGTAVKTDTFTSATSEQDACFTAKSGRYVRLKATSELAGGPWAAAAELNVTGS
ncbi:endo-alpha-N-acetylgalactosaminidase family protein [Actinokineospora sp. HUAS TT18]|uniref:endo-alpha-N-acetylgalactosaminidase family protein n=1 Tax=Actinokineospora sp. HUAS TT18 TaxID=3447451 RepID=UPI003F51AEDB